MGENTQLKEDNTQLRGSNTRLMGEKKSYYICKVNISKLLEIIEHNVEDGDYIVGGVIIILNNNFSKNDIKEILLKYLSDRNNHNYYDFIFSSQFSLNTHDSSSNTEEMVKKYILNMNNWDIQLCSDIPIVYMHKLDILRPTINGY